MRRSQRNRQATKYESRDRGSRRNKRRMSNVDSTANVGDLKEMESQGHPIFIVTGTFDKFGIGNMRTRER